MKNKHEYDKLMSQIKVVKDRVRGVVNGTYNGMYLHGRAGTSKTHTVCSTLDTLAVNYAYSNGHLTPIGLFDLISENRDRVIVLDDVSAIFNQPIALQLLMAALGSRHDESGGRYVRYKTAKGDVVVDFTGGIICISNLPLKGHHNEILSALNDRVFVINFEPKDEQIIALLEMLASKGVGGVAAKNCQTVCRFLVNECKLRDIRPTVRLFVDKAIKDFQLYEMGGSETHWKDLIVSNLEQQLVELQHPTIDLSREEQVEAERRIALDIYLNFEEPSERINNWKERIGKSQAAFYRRVSELKKEGRLP
ncbi:hypothetical protein [Gimesia algae]|uniref:AAA family ATPase n=1 Tax=Gimesia algae TaxID=2527971 RepID=A0A517VFE8_9PLAN|nr:hypothetical protein [Gimesia algae]QDT91724.1 hypothetical protein Pan161_33870 [Gimesia algae]